MMTYDASFSLQALLVALILPLWTSGGRPGSRSRRTFHPGAPPPNPVWDSGDQMCCGGSRMDGGPRPGAGLSGGWLLGQLSSAVLPLLRSPSPPPAPPPPASCLASPSSHPELVNCNAPSGGHAKIFPLPRENMHPRTLEVVLHKNN